MTTLKEVFIMIQIILFLHVVSVQCVSPLRIKIPENSENEDVRLTIDLIEYCYPSNKVIGLVGNAVNFPVYKNERNSYLLLSSAAKNVTASLNQLEDRIHHQRNHHVDLYVVEESTPEILWDTIKNLKQTNWWHADQLFVLTTMKNVCEEAPIFFLYLIELKINNGVFVCHNFDHHGPSISTSNPIDEFAPEPWEKLGKLYDHPNAPSFFKASYGLNPEICANLLFDRGIDHTYYGTSYESKTCGNEFE